MLHFVIKNACLAVVLALLYFHIVLWQNPILGWFLLTAYLGLTGSWWENIFSHIFGWKKRSWMTYVLSWCFTLLLLGLAMSVVVVWYRATPFVIWLAFAMVALDNVLAYWLTRKKRYRHHPEEESAAPWIVFRKQAFFFATVIVLVIAGLYLLAVSRSSAVLFSPWQTIAPAYLLVFFAAVFLTGCFLFSSYKTNALLFLIVSLSVLQHAYLPLIHELPWGGDVWRHIAVETKLLSGEPELPVLFGPEGTSRDVAGYTIPDAFLVPHKYAYGQLWGLSVLLARTLRLNLIPINIWLVPILWAFVLPLLLFRIGRIIFSSRRLGLFLAALGLLPFSFQALGSLTLPVSLGYLTFFFALAFWLQYLRDGDPRQRNFTFALALCMIFGYPLHFILIWSVIFFSFIAQALSKTQGAVRLAAGGIAVAASIWLLPLVEILGKISQVPWSWNLRQIATQIAGQWSGWFYGSAIRPHDILPGNFMFNHTPAAAFVSTVFTDWRWWVMVMMALLLVIAVYGVWRLRSAPEERAWPVLGLLASLTIGGYMVSWYFLDGDRLFVRRLDVMVAFLLLIFFIHGLRQLKLHYGMLGKKYSVVVAVFLFAWFVTGTYASGPDMRIVSRDEYEAAKYAWKVSLERGVDQKQCVLADTWVLLPLEGISGGKIVGGGFPIDYQFAQPERVVLFNEMIVSPRENVIVLAKEKTGADSCSVILPESLIEQKVEMISGLLRREPKKIGGLLVW